MEKSLDKEDSLRPVATSHNTEKDIDQKEIAEDVAKHYNELKDKGIGARYESRIFYLRNFNNWIKSMVIADALDRVCRDNAHVKDYKVNVLDICCGKGGDLRKWMLGNVRYMVLADIASVSINQCQQRYEEMKNRPRFTRYPPADKNQGPSKRLKIEAAAGQHIDASTASAATVNPIFEAEFIVADCTKKRLKEVYKDSNIKFDIASCQFSFHYSFESEEKADMMLRNACECLRPGGYFIGTTPNAYEIVKRARKSETGIQFGNSVYNIKFNQKEDTTKLFGGKYDFALEGVVDCPEFLVYMPLMEKLAEKYDMKLLYCKTFSEVFNEYSAKEANRELLFRMKALEAYPCDPRARQLPQKLMGEKREYEKARDIYYQERERLGLLSRDESEATSIYVTFAFQKKLSEDLRDVQSSA